MELKDFEVPSLAAYTAAHADDTFLVLGTPEPPTQQPTIAFGMFYRVERVGRDIRLVRHLAREIPPLRNHLDHLLRRLDLDPHGPFGLGFVFASRHGDVLRRVWACSVGVVAEGFEVTAGQPFVLETLHLRCERVVPWTLPELRG